MSKQKSLPAFLVFGLLVSDTGKVIRNDCNICHTVLSDSARPLTITKTIDVQHPVDLVNLGDISMFQYVECHPKQ